MSFVCDRCSKCCRTHRVPVTDQDVARLKLSAGDDVSEWLELVAAEQLDMIGEPETVVETRLGRRVLVLKHVDNACVFLGPAGCRVHPLRPRACRAYPYDRPTTSNEGQPLKHPNAVGLHPAPLCPPETGYLRIVDDKISAYHDERQAHLREVKERDLELSSYAELVMNYNRKQRLRQRLGRRAWDGNVFLQMLYDAKLPEL